MSYFCRVGRKTKLTRYTNRSTILLSSVCTL